MTDQDEFAALAHIERTLAESYRKEIDQEENLWRSLPFFAATLALQLAALFQVVGHLPASNSWPALPAIGLVATSLLCSLGALGVLAASILPAKFRYVSNDVALLDYALSLIGDQRAAVEAGHPAAALQILLESLSRQYAAATDNNRHINDRTEKLRSVAGLLTIFAVVSTLVLVAVSLDNYIPSHAAQGASIEPARQPTDPPEAAAAAQRPDSDPAPAAAAHAGGHQGVVHDAGRAQNARAAARSR